MRGLRTRELSWLSGDRIIPARAGFTGDLAGMAFILRDHPRACGVYMDEEIYVLGGGGSSPRVRGLPGSWIVEEGPRRIIPARAGFTTAHPSERT